MGTSDAATAAAAAFEAAAVGHDAVLITGERGCRAPEVARGLYEWSGSRGSFLTVDCRDHGLAEVPAVVLANRQSHSRLVDQGGRTLATDVDQGGMLFLDHAEALSSWQQRHLVRAFEQAAASLETATPLLPNVRLVVAWSGGLASETPVAGVHQDLLRRLPCRIDIPPLRQRAADVAELAQVVSIQEFGAALDLSQEAVSVLASLPWAGNLDELSGMVRGLAQLGRTVQAMDILGLQTLDVLGYHPKCATEPRPSLSETLRTARRRFERDYIAAVLEHHRWSMGDAARTLGIDRANLYRKTRQLGITRAIPPTGAAR